MVLYARHDAPIFDCVCVLALATACAQDRGRFQPAVLQTVDLDLRKQQTAG